MTRRRRSPIWLVWIACVVLTRLPQLLSPDLVLDPDEAVLGQMAVHEAAGERLDVLFAGQSYGLSLLEVGLAALVFRLFGVSTVALKVAMMSIWMAGGALVIAAVGRLGGRRAAWLSLILFAAGPGWSEWSMKARGGYLTAFLLSALVIYLYSRLRVERGRHLLLTGILGAAAALVPFAQPVWAPVVLSFLAVLLHQRRRLHDLVGLTVGAGSAVVSVLLAVAFHPAPVHSPRFSDPAVVPAALVALPGDVVTSLSGVYLLTVDHSTGPGTKVAGILWSVALAAVIIRAACVARTRRDPLGRATLLSLFGVLALYPFISGGQHCYRYLLPLTQVMVVYLAVEFCDRRWPARLAAGILVPCGLIALLETPRCFLGASRSTTGVTLATALDRLADHLLTRDVHHAYALGAMCQYTLPFMTHERIRVRGPALRDRLPENARAVDRAFRAGEKTALICPIHIVALFEERVKRVGIAVPSEPEVIGGAFVVVHDPTPELLSACLFVLHERVDEFP